MNRSKKVAKLVLANAENKKELYDIMNDRGWTLYKVPVGYTFLYVENSVGIIWINSSPHPVGVGSSTSFVWHQRTFGMYNKLNKAFPPGNLKKEQHWADKVLEDVAESTNKKSATNGDSSSNSRKLITDFEKEIEWRDELILLLKTKVKKKEYPNAP